MTEGRTFQIEKISDLWDGLGELFAAHYEEVNQRPGDKIDKAGYRHLESLGTHLFCTARLNGNVVGYCSYFLNASPHDQVMQAHEDFIFIRMEHRGFLGIEFQHWMDRILSDKGCHRVFRERPTVLDIQREVRRGPIGYHLAALLWYKDLKP